MKTENEIWKDIPGYEGLYQVSNLGRVKTLGRKKGVGTGNKERHSFIMKSTSTSKDGYIRISLCKLGVKKSFKIHHLVAIAFLGHVRCGMLKVVDHKDNNKLNNSASNLQIVTNRINTSKDRLLNKNKKSRYIGVGFDKRRSKWRSYIRVNGKQTFIGYFNTEEEAYMSYKNKVEELCYNGILSAQEAMAIV